MKIILTIILLIFPFQTLAFTEISEGSSVDKYVLNDKDNEIIELIFSRVENIFLKRPNISSYIIIDALNKYKNKTNNKRIIRILEEVIKKIENKDNKITILEGWNIFDIDDYLFSKKLIKEGEYILYVQNREKIISLSKFFQFLGNQETLEGYLYPDTYEINRNNFKINTFVIKQLESFEIKVYKKLFLGKYNNNITESVINLASIVEKEEKNILEKPVIAGILKKRVKEFWNIGADATVCYPYELTSKECKNVVSKYINIKTSYNTRFIIGLPPTPIGNPSFDTINATLNDTDTSYYYYLHDIKTGKAYYAETNIEHNENKNLYLK